MGFKTPKHLILPNKPIMLGDGLVNSKVDISATDLEHIKEINNATFTTASTTNQDGMTPLPISKLFQLPASGASKNILSWEFLTGNLHQKPPMKLFLKSKSKAELLM